MTGRYASGTEVSAEKSRAEIERTLQRWGATSFMYGWDADRAVVGFVFQERQIRFVITMPDRNDRRFTHHSRGARTADAAYKEWEQACRQRWRALALVIKAKLEAVDSGIAEVEDEFLAYIVLPDGNDGRRVAPPADRQGLRHRHDAVGAARPRDRRRAMNDPLAEMKQRAAANATPEQLAHAMRRRDQLTTLINTLAALPSGTEAPAECSATFADLVSSSDLAFATALTLADAVVRVAREAGRDVVFVDRSGADSTEVAATLLTAVSNADLVGARALWLANDQPTCLGAVGALLWSAVELKRQETHDG